MHRLDLICEEVEEVTRNARANVIKKEAHHED
jgi:hypothetical protein